MSISQTGNIQAKLSTVRAQFDTLRGSLRTQLDQLRSQLWSRAGGAGGLSNLRPSATPIKTYTSNAGGGRLLPRLLNPSPLRRQTRIGGPLFGGGSPRTVGPYGPGGYATQQASRSHFPSTGGQVSQRGAPGKAPIMTYGAGGTGAPIKTFTTNVSNAQGAAVRTPIRTY